MDRAHRYACDTAGTPAYLPFREVLLAHLRDLPSHTIGSQLRDDDRASSSTTRYSLRLSEFVAPPSATRTMQAAGHFEAVSDLLVRVARASERSGLLLYQDDLARLTRLDVLPRE